jgi:hypothetical protein
VIEQWRIPSLGPRVGRVVRAGLAVLGVFCTIIFGIGAVMALQSMPSEQVLSEYQLRSPYALDHADNKLLALNGRPLPASVGAGELSRRLLAGGPRAELTVETPSGQVQVFLLTRSAAHASELYGGLASWVGVNLAIWLAQLPNTIISVAVGGLLLWRRSRDAVAMLFVFQALVEVFGPLGWPAVNMLGIYVPMRVLDLIANGVFLMLPFVFPDGAIRSWWRLATIAIIWLFQATGVVTVVFGLAMPVWLDSINLLFNFALYPSCLLALVLRYRSTRDPALRQQLKPALLGLGVGMIVLGVPTAASFISAHYAHEPSTAVRLNSIGAVLSCLTSATVSLGFLVALLRYRLYDADATIRRSVSYGALAVGMLVTFTVVEKVIEALGQQYLGGSAGPVGSGVAAALVAVVFVPLNERVSTWAKRRFEGNLIALREELPERVGDMRETATPAQIGHTVLLECHTRIHAARGAVVLAGEFISLRDVERETAGDWLANALPGDGQLLDDPTDPLFPVRVPLRTGEAPDLGWLLLGPRPDGSLYGREERHALTHIAGPISRALWVAGERQHTQSTLAGQLDTYAEKIRQLEDRLAQALGPSPSPSMRPA